VLEAACGLAVSPGGVARALHRAARAAEPTYAAITEGVRASETVAPDETGWRVGGQKAWLHVFVGEGVTCYEVARDRGYEEAAAVLGEDFAGVLERDGWAPYRRFTDARHQSCIAHLIRRSQGMIEDSERGQARVPHALKRILSDALELRDARDLGKVTPRALRRRVRQLEERVDRLLEGRVRYPPNVRLLRHLAGERDQPVHVPHVRGRRGDQLARRAGAAPRGGRPQALGWQRDLVRCAHLRGAREPDPHLPPAGSRPPRGDPGAPPKPEAGGRAGDAWRCPSEEGGSLMAHRHREDRRYRVVVYERAGDRDEIIVDLAGAAFIAAVASFTGHDKMRAHLGQGGPEDIVAHLAILAADQLGGDHDHSIAEAR
jgi:hypothetical protein